MNQAINKLSTLWVALFFLISCGGSSQEDKEDQKPKNDVRFELKFSEDRTEVTLGNQTWMTQNLNTRIFRNGDSIPIAKDAADWEKAEWMSSPMCGYYDNKPENAEKYGLLYNWYAVMDERGLAPEGWQIPEDSAWMQLKNFLNHEEVAGYYLKSTSDWLENNKGNNASGFNALPAGCFSIADEQYEELGKVTYWWSTKSGSTAPAAQTVAAWVWTVDFWALNSFDHADFYKGNGFSVRCLKN